MVCAIVVCVVFVIGRAYCLYAFAAADKRHTAFTQCGSDVKAYLAGYSSALKEAAKAKDTRLLARFYAKEYDASNRGSWSFEEGTQLAGATYQQLSIGQLADESLEGVLDDWSRYLDGISKVDQAKLKLSLIEDFRTDGNVVVSVKYVLDGVTSNEKFQDRFFFRWELEPSDIGEFAWRLVNEELDEGVRTSGSADVFRTLDPSITGISYAHRRDPKLDKNAPEVKLKFSVIEHAFGGVSAVDVLGEDGLPEVLFLDGVDSRFYRNVTSVPGEQPRFLDVTEETGLGGIDQAHTGLFVDFDNDGDKDLFVTRYAAHCKLFRNDGAGKFSDATDDFELSVEAPCVSACILDFDQDGFLDIYIAVNGNAYDTAPDIPFYAVNGEPNILLRNVQGKKFVDVSSEAGIGSTGWTLAVTSGDFNCDGWPDLAVANDFGRKVLYRNKGDGTFEECTKEAGTLDFSGGMGIAFTDLNGDRFPDLLTSNIESGQRWFGEEITLWQYIRNISRTEWLLEDLPEYNELYGLLGDDWRTLGLQIGRGNSVFCNNKDGTFEEWSDCHAKRAGWAWSVNPFDHDADGDVSLYVSNGWISGPNPKAPDL